MYRKNLIPLLSVALISVGHATLVSAQTEEPDASCTERELGTLYFDFDESSIRAMQEPVLEEVYECLLAWPDEGIRVEAHTDERGHRSWNLSLSQRRAEAIRAFLSQMGADVERVQVFGFGENNPVAEGHDESQWRLNRRAEFHWSSEPQCTASTDCPPGHFCNDSQCDNACTEVRSPCPSEWFCDGSMCVECLTNEDCTGDEICSDDWLCFECLSDSDCDEGTACEQGACR